MNSLTNPTVPTPLEAVEIQAAIQVMQMALETNLTWLTHGYGRAYRFREPRGESNAMLFFPEVYLGKQDNGNLGRYYMPSPDNKKKGMCFFVVEKERQENFQQNAHNYLAWNVGICFSANLDLINDTLTETEDFTQNLIREVREVLTRYLPKHAGFFRLELQEVTRRQDEVYKEFDGLQKQRPNDNYGKVPITIFRFNCVVRMIEQCGDIQFDRCAAIQQNISKEEVYTCITPTIDFTDPDFVASLSPEQTQDIIDTFCP